MEFKTWAENNDADKDFLDWIGVRTAREAWDESPSGSWMLWMMKTEMAFASPYTPNKGASFWLYRGDHESKTHHINCVAIALWCAQLAAKSLEHRGQKTDAEIEASWHNDSVNAWLRGSKWYLRKPNPPGGLEYTRAILSLDRKNRWQGMLSASIAAHYATTKYCIAPGAASGASFAASYAVEDEERFEMQLADYVREIMKFEPADEAITKPGLESLTFDGDSGNKIRLVQRIESRYNLSHDRARVICDIFHFDPDYKLWADKEEA